MRFLLATFYLMVVASCLIGCSMVQEKDSKAAVAPTTHSFNLLHQFMGHNSTVWSIAWSPDSQKVAAGSTLWPIQIWDLSTGKLNKELEGGSGTVKSVSWSNDGKYLAAVNFEPTQNFRIWDLQTGQLAFVNEPSDGARVTDSAWSPNGRAIAVTVVDELGTAQGTKSEVPQGASPPVRNSKIEIRSLGDWGIQASIPFTYESNMATWSPDSKHIAFVATTAYGDPDTQLVVVLSMDDKSVTQYSPQHKSYIHALSWSSDGHYISTASSDRTVKIWDANSYQLLATLNTGNHALSMDWSPDGKRLAVGSDDSTARVWDVGSQKLVATLTHINSVDAVKWSPDGRYLATGGDDDTVNIWTNAP